MYNSIGSCEVKAFPMEIGDVAPGRIALAVVAVFIAGTIFARAAGWWESSITSDEIRSHIALMDQPEYDHLGR